MLYPLSYRRFKWNDSHHSTAFEKLPLGWIAGRGVRFSLHLEVSKEDAPHQEEEAQCRRSTCEAKMKYENGAPRKWDEYFADVAIVATKKSRKDQRFLDLCDAVVQFQIDGNATEESRHADGIAFCNMMELVSIYR